ncbi:hypothetical protein PATSB16_11120 [Pandoraea thiooxydans]|nr:hypothetical protein PATSB16_11120 [Pandoraea thiooxydans]
MGVGDAVEPVSSTAGSPTLCRAIVRSTRGEAQEKFQITIYVFII